MKNQPLPKIVIALLCFVLFSQSIKAQDANYWSSSYNPAGLLTPGAVIALNRDSGVMFFNPALLGYNSKNSASISGTIYQLSKVDVKNGAGTGLDMNSSSTSIIPQMVSATISFNKGAHPFTIGYALTHDQFMNYQANQQRDGKLNVLSDTYSPGDEYYLGQIANQNSSSQTGGLISGGVKISDQLALGLTAEADLHKQTYSTAYSARAIFNATDDELGEPPFANSEYSYLANYYTLGLKFKAGLAYNLDKSHLGLTVTSPLLNLYGRANILSDNVINNLIETEGGLRDTIHILANSRQQSLKAKYKMPLSIGAGYAYDLKKGQIFFSTEYFLKVSQYSIITPKAQTYIRGVGQEDEAIYTPEFLRFADARKSVINFGVGASYLLKPDLTGYLSLYTDFNNINQNAFNNDFIGTSPYTSYYDVYHCQTGINIKKRKFNFRAGLILAYGSTNKYMQTVNFDHPNEDNFLVGDPVNTHESQFVAGLMFSYIHNL